MGLLKNYPPSVGGVYALYLKSIFLFSIFLVFSSLAGNATIYYVSTSGNDSNSGTSPDKPWKSLTKVNNFSPQQGDQILFNRGDEWVGTITVSASGSSGNPVVYGAYGTGSNPKIYGSEEITGWTLHSGNIYKATVNSAIEQLFVNNSRARLARYPNSGYFLTTSVQSTTQFTSKELNSGINYKGATWIGRTTAFTMYNRNVAGSSSQTITLESSPSYGLGVNKGFFLANKLEFLDQAGEWYYEPSTKTVYLWAPNGDTPSNYQVRGSTSAYGVNISGKNYIVIKDFDILHSSNTGVYINNANYITIDNNRIFSPDLFGIHMPSNSNSPVFKNNYIYQAGGGIRCFGTSATITDNIVEDTGLHQNINKTVFTHDNFGTAIYSRNNSPVIQYNRILNAGYDGINWKGTKGSIKYNFVNGACQVLDDGGGIYTYNKGVPTASAGSEVMYNIVLNVHGNRVGYTDSYNPAYGIYMDNETTGVTVKNNTVAYVACGLYIHDAGNILLQYNTIFDALLGCRASGEYSDSYLYDNIFYSLDRKGDFTWWTNRHQMFQARDGSSPVYNNNKYYHPNQTMVFRAGSNMAIADWKSATGEDKNSTLFISPLAEGETEQLFYNDTKQTKTIDLGNAVYRDLEGNNVSKLTLEPFTSKILIKKNGSNQSPVILDQSFDIYAPKTANELLAQVAANDHDSGQTLSYSIIKGNETDLFSINSSTGEIFTNLDIKSSVNQSIALLVEVKDNAVYPLSATASVTLNIIGVEDIASPDITSPVISSFSIPATDTSLTIPILAFTVTDNLAVAGYKLTETPNAPLAGDIDWNTSAPLSYTFSQSGIKTLYAWAKDDAGNVSDFLYGTVTITLENTKLLSPLDSIEHVTICEGEEYMGWTASGVYERVVTRDTVIQSKGINQIPNSDFRNGTGGWTKWSTSGYSLDLGTCDKNYISSPTGMLVNCTANGTTVSSLQLITGGAISVEAGKEYELTFYAKATVEFYIGRLYIHQGITPWTKYGAFEELSPKITTNWSEHKIRFTATHSAADAQLRIYLGNSLPAGQTLFIDDVSFAEVTEETVQINQKITTHLTVTPTQYSTENITIIEGEDYMGWTESGVYERTLVSTAGCDSLVTTNLTVSSPVVPEPEPEPAPAPAPVPDPAQPADEELITEYITICEGEDYLGWTASGVYERVVTRDTVVQSKGINQIPNSDFSNGTVGWTKWTASGYSINLEANNQDYISSPASLQVNCTANGTTVSSLQLITGGAISVEAGKEYELTFYAKATVDFNIGRLYIHQAISPWTKYGAFEVLSPKITTNWSEHKIRFTATHTAADAQVADLPGQQPSGRPVIAPR
jgi:parallel beta-helix repeat protein